MHGIAKRGLALVAVASGLVLGTAGIAAADATATGEVENSGGAGSGNLVQAPANLPVNLCGNQVNAAGAAGNFNLPARCRIDTDGGLDATATGEVENSGGLLSGNLVQLPITAPVNACGNQLNGVGALLNFNGPARCEIS